MDKTFTPEISRPETQSQKTHTSAKSLLSLLQLNRSCSKMVYTYTPTYYSSLHDSITSICKNILPFSFKKKRLPAIAAAEQKLSKHQSDNLKWQQESFHQILNLMGLCKEGILQETEVSAFRSHLLDTLIASPLDYEHTVILRDKLIFLQELFYAKCITEEEYHSSKRPLLQRLAVQGAEIEARDLIIGELKAKSDEEWSAIDLKDEQTLIGKESLTSKSKSKHGSAIKPIKGAASVFGFVTSQKNGKLKEEKGVLDLGKENFGPIAQNFTSSACGKNELGLSQENPFWNCHVKDKESETRSILMSGSLPHESSANVEKQSGGKFKKKPFGALFQRDEQGSRENGSVSAEREPKAGKKQWGFDGLKKWKKNDSGDETVPLSLNEKSDGETYLGKLVASPIGEGPDTKQIKKKLHSDGTPSDFFVDKVLGDKIKKELLRIQTELCATNPNALFSDDQIEAISTRLPVDKADLKKFFPKSWCDRYGDVVLDVVRKEFKNHVGEMKSQQTAAGEKQRWATFDGEMKSRQTAAVEMKRWTTFDDNDDENCHPNLFAPAPPQVHPVPMKQANFPPVTAELVYSSRQY